MNQRDLIQKLPKKFQAKKFEGAIHYFNRALHLQDEINKITNNALKDYGDHGPLISGVGRDHFPANVKDTLRLLHRDKNEFIDKGFASKPKRVHDSTMRALYQAVKSKWTATENNPKRPVKRTKAMTNPTGNYAGKMAQFVNVITTGSKTDLQNARQWLQSNKDNMAKSPVERRAIKSLLTIVNRELKGYARNPVKKKRAKNPAGKRAGTDPYDGKGPHIIFLFDDKKLVYLTKKPGGYSYSTAKRDAYAFPTAERARATGSRIQMPAILDSVRGRAGIMKREMPVSFARNIQRISVGK